jgi:hypothetical protein
MATIPDAEWQRYVDEHEAIHGHKPLRDLLSGKLCTHPSHDEARRIIDGPGVNVQIAFDPHELISDDDPRVLKFQRDYEMAVAENKLRIAEMDDEDRRALDSQCTVGIHDVRETWQMDRGRKRRMKYCRRQGCGWRAWA